MARLCAICSHGERARIETEIAAGASYRSIGRRYGMTGPSVSRHVANHGLLVESAPSPIPAPPVAEDGTALSELIWARRIAADLLQRALESGRLDLAGQALRNLHSILKTEGLARREWSSTPLVAVGVGVAAGGDTAISLQERARAVLRLADQSDDGPALPTNLRRELTVVAADNPQRYRETRDAILADPDMRALRRAAGGGQPEAA